MKFFKNIFISFFYWLQKRQDYEMIEMFPDGSQRIITYKGNQIIYGERK